MEDLEYSLKGIDLSYVLVSLLCFISLVLFAYRMTHGRLKITISHRISLFKNL